jgi:uncharacterized membrane protein YgdD (TMEM256/DUF423 family)
MVKSRMLIGLFLVLVSIALGALAAHLLKKILLPESLDSFKTGVNYCQLMGILLILGSNEKLKMNRLVARMLVAAAMFFSGSIFILAFKSKISFSVSFLGPITPVGGILMMVALCIWGWSIWKNKS